jgi:hypothetical protein
MKLIKNPRGTSLVTVLMATGIGAIVLAGITTMITDVFKSQRTAQSKDAHRELTTNIRQLLTDPVICSASFSGHDPAGTGFTTTQIVDAATPPNVKYQTGKNYLNNLVTITGFEVRGFTADNPAVSPKIGKVELNIKMNKLGSTIGSPEMTTTVFLQATLNAADTNLNSCYALGLADSLWQISPTNMADIYYPSGNVGIGTTSPGTILHIHHATNQNLLFGSSSNIAGGMGITSSNDAINTPLPLELRGSPTIFSVDNLGERMRVDTNGNVGIGTTSPTHQLSVQGNGSIGGSLNVGKGWDSAGFQKGAITSLDEELNKYQVLDVAGKDIRFATSSDATGSGNGPIAMFLQNTTGNVGIGTIPSYKLDVAGSLRVTGQAYTNSGNGNFAILSDVRYKDLHGPYERGLEEILNIDTIRFNYKKDNPLGSDSINEYVGVSAQELKKAIPEAIQEEKEGYLTLNSSPVLWALLNAVKELYHHETAQFAFQKRDIALMKAEAEVKIAKLEAESTSKDQQIAHLKARAEKNEKENVVIKFYLCAKDSSAAFCH